jgi:hypothetical protein
LTSRRIHEKLGTAGLIISIVALFAALGGGAYAASGGLTGKQKKEVEKIAKKVAKPGPAGAPGANGAQGAAGPVGSAGKDGANGTNGSNGAPGTPGKPGESGFTSVLPSGKTETGAWSLAISPTNQFFEFRVSISFPIPLKEGSEKVFYFTHAKVEAQEFGSSGCKWKRETPNVKPESTVAGTLCVFASEEEEVNFSSFHTPGEEFGFGYGPSGSVPSFIHPEPANPLTETTNSTANGVWAVTAP